MVAAAIPLFNCGATHAVGTHGVYGVRTRRFCVEYFDGIGLHLLN